MEEASGGGMEELDRDSGAGIACGMGTRRENKSRKDRNKMRKSGNSQDFCEFSPCIKIQTVRNNNIRPQSFLS